jgi:hypothetical protein
MSKYAHEHRLIPIDFGYTLEDGKYVAYNATTKANYEVPKNEPRCLHFPIGNE